MCFFLVVFIKADFLNKTATVYVLSTNTLDMYVFYIIPFMSHLSWFSFCLALDFSYYCLLKNLCNV